MQVINAARYQTDYRLVHAMANTMAVVFPNVYIIGVGRFSNSMAIATEQPSDLANYPVNIGRLPQGSPPLEIGELSLRISNVRPWRPDPNGFVFSDNYAPV